MLAFAVALGLVVPSLPAQARRPGPTRPSPKSPANNSPADKPPKAAPVPTGPKFDVPLASLDDAPPSVLFSDGDGDVVWGRAGADRSIVRLPLAQARELTGRIADFARRAIDSKCGTAAESSLPSPVVVSQVRANILRTFALACAMRGEEVGLVFVLSDSVAGPRGGEPVLVQPWDVACGAMAGFVDSVTVALSAGDSASRPAPLTGKCPRIYTAADIRQLANQLLGEGGDSAASVLGELGPRVLAPVVSTALSDPFPLARKRAARVLERVLQQPLGIQIDPDAFVAVLAQRWREERDRAVADTVGRALGRLVANNPGRIRTVDTLLQVVRERLPVLAQRARSLTPADVDRGAADAAPLARALDLVAALGDAAGPVVGTVAGLAGEHGSAVDVLVARTVETLGPYASAAGDAVRGLLESPTPLESAPRQAASVPEALAVATAAARALARIGQSGRQDLLEAWLAHRSAMALDTMPPPPPPPTAAPAAPGAPSSPGAAGGTVNRDSVPAAPAPSVIDRATRAWGSPAARAIPLEYEIRRAALVAGFAGACAADTAVIAPLGQVAGEALTFAVAPPSSPDVEAVARLLTGLRERTRVAAVDALGDCGKKAIGQIEVLFVIANTTPDDPRGSDALRHAANRAIPRVRRIE